MGSNRGLKRSPLGMLFVVVASNWTARKVARKVLRGSIKMMSNTDSYSLEFKSTFANRFGKVYFIGESAVDIQLVKYKKLYEFGLHRHRHYRRQLTNALQFNAVYVS